MSGPPPPYNPNPGHFYQDGGPPGPQYNQFQGPVQTQPGWNPQPANTFQPYQPQAQPYQPGPYQQPYPQQPYGQQPQPQQTIIVTEHQHRREGMSDEQCCCVAILGACCLACCLSD